MSKATELEGLLPREALSDATVVFACSAHRKLQQTCLVSAHLNSYLRIAFPKPCFDRPFVCDGWPELSTVIILGENPATATSSDWWAYWDDQLGFDWNAFLKEYKSDRIAQGKQPLSQTRGRLARLRDAGIRCVETNVYPNERLGGSGAGAQKSGYPPDAGVVDASPDRCSGTWRDRGQVPE